MAEQLRTILRDSHAAHGGGHAGDGGHGAVDEWHHHSAAEGRPQEEHASTINAWALVRWLIVLLVAVVVVVIAVAKLTEMAVVQHNREFVETNAVIAQDYLTKRSTLDAELATFGAAGPDRARVPITQAMEAVVGRYQGQTRELGADLPKGHPMTQPSTAGTSGGGTGK